MEVQIAYELYNLRSKQDLLYSFPQLIYQDVNGASGIDKKSGEDDEVCEEAISQENIVRLFAVPDQTHHPITFANTRRWSNMPNSLFKLFYQCPNYYGK